MQQIYKTLFPRSVLTNLFSPQELRCVPCHDVNGSLRHEQLVKTVVVNLTGQVVKFDRLPRPTVVGNLHAHSLELVTLCQPRTSRHDGSDQTARTDGVSTELRLEKGMPTLDIFGQNG